MFPDIAYLDWIDGRPEAAAYDLGSSDLRRAPADPDAVAPPALADRPTPDATVEELLAERYGVAPENVLVAAGATHANFLAAATALSAPEPTDPEIDGSDRALVEEPGYEPLLATPRGIGATIDRFRRPSERDYALDPDRIDAAIVEDTALVTVTNRHNPSGRRTDRETLARAARRIAAADAYLLVDEVYAPFSAEPGPGPFGGPTAAGLPSAVVTSSLTKFFGFGDVRLGWLIADAEFVERARRHKHHVPAVAEPSRRLARRALAESPALAEQSRERIRQNRAALAEFVAARQDVAGRVEPGCPYAFLAHEAVDGGAVAAAAWERDLLVVPGRFFDDNARFRIGACRDPAAVREGLDRFGAVLDSLRA